MSKGIILSKKYGVNPAIPLCFYCNKPKNQIILAGRIRRVGDFDAEAPRNMVWDREPCEECKGWMEKGILFISVDEAKSKGDLKNPYRTGGWAVVKDEAVERMGIQPPELLAQILKRRTCFLPDEVWNMLGLPREEVKPQ